MGIKAENFRGNSLTGEIEQTKGQFELFSYGFFL